MSPCADLTPPSPAALAFLRAVQLGDSFFPSGLYTLSHGLESFVQAGLVAPGDVEPLLLDYLEQVVGPGDAVALAHAHGATERGDLARLAEVDYRLFAMKLVREAREASCRVGKRLLGTVVGLSADLRIAEYRSWVDCGRCPGTAAVALGAAAASLGIGKREAMLLELYTFATSFLGAALRLIRFDHLEAQRILARAAATMLRLVEENAERNLGEMRAFAPWIDLMGMAHERAEVRLFVS
jgi:urease accessory protein